LLTDPQGDVLVAEPPGHDVAEAREDLRRPDRPIVDLATLERAGLFDWTRGRSRISEEFRLAQRQLLRTAFSPTAEAGLSNLLLVTSARPGEGKSFTALNLACSVALQGDHHVLLIDSDAKRDSICQALGLGDAPGILDLASDPTLDVSKLILHTEIDKVGASSDLHIERRTAVATEDADDLIAAVGHCDIPLKSALKNAEPCTGNADGWHVRSAALALAVTTMTAKTEDRLAHRLVTDRATEAAACSWIGHVDLRLARGI
jgi:hypothetical protein